MGTHNLLLMNRTLAVADKTITLGQLRQAADQVMSLPLRASLTAARIEHIASTSGTALS
jgi:hypothetical protein